MNIFINRRLVSAPNWTIISPWYDYYFLYLFIEFVNAVMKFRVP